MAWMSHWVFILYILLLPWAGLCSSMGLSFFNPAHAFFVGRLILLPCCSVASAMLSFNLCLLGLLWACHILFPLLSSHCLVLLLGLFSYYLRLPWPILSLRASLACFIPLGIIGPFHSYIPMGFC